MTQFDNLYRYDGSYMPDDFWLKSRVMQLTKRGHRIGGHWVMYVGLCNALGCRYPSAGQWQLRNRLKACVRPR